MRLPASALLACAAALAAGCSHAPGYPPDPIPRPTAVTDFAVLYSANCAACHGANGQGGPAIVLANPEYQALVRQYLSQLDAKYGEVLDGAKEEIKTIFGKNAA